MKYIFLFISFFFVSFITAYPQEVLENNPPSVKWYRVTTPHFRVLYPKGYEEQAQRVANTFEHIRDAESNSLGVKPKRISIILQNQSSISNGFVSIVPKRSEFFTMPPQDYNFGGTNDWLNQLATHEYRHIVQFEKANTGFNKALYYLFGPATLSAMSMIAVPQWFWEGDAVAAETAFTHSGRGRIPNFGLVFRTNFLEGRTFNYNKQYLRSYKHNIPDHYVLGYHMIGYLRKRTGDTDIWGKISKRSWDIPFMPFRFSNSIKRESGLSVNQLYKEMSNDLTKSWEEEARSLQVTPYQQINVRKAKAYTDYRYPNMLPDGSILVMKSGIGDVIQFSRIKDGKESKVFIPGIVNDAGMLSVSGSTIVWSEYGYDPRWLVKSYSQIKSYDAVTKEYKVITRKSRYSGAVLSPDGKKIVTTESDQDYKNTLTVIDVNGNVVKSFENPTNAFYSMSRWSNDGLKIVSLKTQNSKRSVVVTDYATGKETTLIGESMENIGHPVLYGNFLFYNSPISGIDNIYVFDIEKSQSLQVTSSKYGAYNPFISPDGKTIYYNEQSKDGFDVVSIPFDPTSWKQYTPNIDSGELYSVLSEQEKHPDLFDSIPQTKYETAKHSKLSGIINPYSWGVYFNSTFTQADIGLSSQNILSTTSFKAGYLYDIYERTGAWRVGVSYQGWFPIIDINATFGKRSLNEGDLTYLDIVPGDTVLATKNLTFEWKEKNLEVGLRIPLLTTNSKYHGNVSIANYVGLTETEEFTNSITGNGRIITPQLPVYWNRELIDNGKLIYNHFSLTAFRLLKQSKRDINSKWGQTIILNGYGTPYGGDYKGQQFSFYTVLYFPGLFKHHSLWGYWGYQASKFDLLSRSDANDPYQDNGAYFFRNQIPLPRGISVSRFEEFYSMSANYTLPLWYPDLALGPVLNIQRFRGNAFVDYGFGASQFNTTITQSYISVGGELKMDINIFRFLPQFDIGVRYSYGIRPNTVTSFEFLIGLINF